MTIFLHDLPFVSRLKQLKCSQSVVQQAGERMTSRYKIQLAHSASEGEKSQIRRQI